jgi:hypothetical protein
MVKLTKKNKELQRIAVCCCALAQQAWQRARYDFLTRSKEKSEAKTSFG